MTEERDGTRSVPANLPAEAGTPTRAPSPQPSRAANQNQSSQRREDAEARGNSLRPGDSAPLRFVSENVNPGAPGNVHEATRHPANGDFDPPTP